jgi:hypothetical protein
MAETSHIDDDTVHDLMLIEAAFALLPNSRDSDKALAVLRALHQRLLAKAEQASLN